MNQVTSNRSIKEVALEYNNNIYYIRGKKRHAHLVTEIQVLIHDKVPPFENWSSEDFANLNKQGNRGFLLDNDTFVRRNTASHIAFLAGQLRVTDTRNPPFGLKAHDLSLFD